ncbi:PDZ domain-containing protein [Flavobacterium microcysteis]|uniref:PDZ domain-containing protein n=1 Tax=Flavobacterium microcysteis TaxID=2596891 RepID=A0A501QMS5_9FLAO|nr:PDZ domain-containing protein [Flavobacterium microcysteis]TPD73525.1 PDZ domain-containing protein [Flavobacterium microcysteis]
MKLRLLVLFLLVLPCLIFAQEGFQWNSNKNKIEIPFQHIYNLIIIPVEINNVKLNMLLDTGADNSMIFSLPENDSIQFKNYKKVKVRGIGSEEIIEALLSVDNKIKISSYEDNKFPILIVLDQDVNFSSRLGIPVNGVIGYSFFKECPIEINYQKKIVTIHRTREFLEKKKFKKYLKHPIQIIDKRPYIDVVTKIEEDTLGLKLLIDIGLGDGLWLFENKKIKAGNNYFEDILGRGLNGLIKGKKSRVKSIKVADFTLDEALVSYPEEMYFPKIGIIEGRNGSIGGEILHRFNVILDYQQQYIYLKKNSNFKKPFNYNMSGIVVQHNGVEFVQESIRLQTKSGYGVKVDGGLDNFNESNFMYKFSLKPVFEIATVRSGSPADLAGLQPGDKIIRINKKKIHGYTIQKISDLLQSEDGKWIYMDVERNSKPIAFKFQLKKIL